MGRKRLLPAFSICLQQNSWIEQHRRLHRLLLPLEQFPSAALLALNSSPLSIAPSAAHTGDPTLNGTSLPISGFKPSLVMQISDLEIAVHHH